MQSGGVAPAEIGGHPRIDKRHREGEYGNLSQDSANSKNHSRLHTPVLLQESVDALRLDAESASHPWVVVDATLGEGGHAAEILKRLPADGKLIGIERDRRMLAALALSDPRLVVVEGNFKETARTLKSLGHDQAHAILADIGLSARHYFTSEWGFSFTDGPLDMRLGIEGPTAAELVNEWSESALAKLFVDAGETRGRKIAAGIAEARRKAPVRRTAELAGLVEKILGGAGGRGRKEPVGRKKGSHPATKVFRAIREAVTGELRDLTEFIPDASGVLIAGGRLAVLIYTWEEERIVRKQADALVKGCICPPRFPVCRCGKKPSLRWISRKGVSPSSGEVRKNPSARSAKLLVMEKI